MNIFVVVEFYTFPSKYFTCFTKQVIVFKKQGGASQFIRVEATLKKKSIPLS